MFRRHQLPHIRSEYGGHNKGSSGSVGIYVRSLCPPCMAEKVLELAMQCIGSGLAVVVETRVMASYVPCNSGT